MDVDTEMKRDEGEERTKERRSERRDSHRDSRRDRSPRRRSDHYDEDRRERRSPRRRSRSRSRSRSRRRSASPGRKRRGRTRSRSRSRSRRGDTKEAPFSRSLGGPMNADPAEALEFSKVSKRENRVYVGNLAYDVKYGDLIEFMRGAGEVLFAEVLVTPTGQSKGCGIVEFSTQEDAQRAIKELSETVFMGRPVYLREDRETESRFGATPVPGKIGMAMAGYGGSGGGGGSVPPPRSSVGGNPGNQLYVGNLPYQAGWQDLKDLFRSAGNIVRADINIGIDGRAKGSGTVVYETAKDAQAAISMYHGYEWYGRVLEVREDRYAGLHGSRGRGAPRGLGMGRGFPPRGGYGGRGGGGGGGYGRGGGGRGTGNLYGDYTGPDQNYGGGGGGGGGGGAGGGGGGGDSSYGNGSYGARPNPADLQPSQQIMVRNLPWSTANEDLVELFETTGHVELAEILYAGDRSKGSGVVQFAHVEEAGTAI
ncbi:hypothetical protein FRC16_006118, partial [Serendipita sp. 398]